MISILLLVPLFLYEALATAVTMETFPGASTEKHSGDSAPAISADISAATGLWVDSNGDTFFVDYSTNLVRKMDTSGIITDKRSNTINCLTAEDLFKGLWNLAFLSYIFTQILIMVKQKT